MRQIKFVRGIDQKRFIITIVGGCFFLCCGSIWAISENDKGYWARQLSGDLERFFGFIGPILFLIIGAYLVGMASIRIQNKIIIYDTKINIEAIGEPFYKAGKLRLEIPYEKIDSVSAVQAGGILSPKNLRINMKDGKAYMIAIKDLEEILLLISRFCQNA